jgi:hypothetical protein
LGCVSSIVCGGGFYVDVGDGTVGTEQATPGSAENSCLRCSAANSRFYSVDRVCQLFRNPIRQISAFTLIWHDVDIS